jgi:hypothetical protein
MLLEEALGNGSNCTVVKSAGGGEFIDKPNHFLMLSQAKNRLKPYHEVAKTSSKKKAKLTTEEYTTTIDANTKSRRKCGFCTSTDHIISNCDKRNGFIYDAHEHTLSSTSNSDQRTLKSSLLSLSVPSNNGGGKGIVYDTIGKSYKNANFVIHAVCHIYDTQTKTIETMIYCISFISCMGIVVNDINGSNIWITGTAMSNLIAHSNTKKKYVFLKS